MNFYKKKKIYLSIFFLFFINTVFAANICSNEFRHPDKETSIDQGYPVKNKELLNIYNTEALIKVKNTWHAFASANFILWQANQNSMEIGRFVLSDNTRLGSVINMSFDYEPGFKVGLGFHFDTWNTFIEYTRLHLSNTDDTEKLPENASGINSPWYTTFNHQNIYAKWKLKYDIIDFQFARPFYNGTRLILKPHFGIRSGWIDQNLNINTTLPAIRKADLNNETYLIGGRAGSYADWLIGSGVKITSAIAASLNYQHFKTKYKERTEIAIVRWYKDKIGLFTPNLDLSLGLGYGTYFDNFNWHFDLLIAYDFVYWWNQNTLENNQSSLNNVDASPGDLMLQGLNISFRFDF